MSCLQSWMMQVALLWNVQFICTVIRCVTKQFLFRQSTPVMLSVDVGGKLDGVIAFLLLNRDVRNAYLV